MNYIDTDVLIHSLINQTPALHLRINDMIEEMDKANTFTISWLNIQEVGFVLAKLDQTATFISSNLHHLISSSPISFSGQEFSRAIELAELIGFKDFNDCLHTAITE